MVPLKRGRIINFASLLSFQGGFTVPAYATSKGGIIQLTKALSNEWSKEGVCVNAIAPGYIETEMNEKLLQDPVRLPQISERIPAGRWGRPEDFAGPVVFLASKASQYVCGEVLVVDGVSSFSSWRCPPFRFPPITFPNWSPGFSPSPSLGSPLYPMISWCRMMVPSRRTAVHIMLFRDSGFPFVDNMSGSIVREIIPRTDYALGPR